MRIAMLAPPWLAVPPPGYGGIEWVVSLLTEELHARGHEVTLFASGGSKTAAELITVFDEPPSPRMHENMPDSLHAAVAFREILTRAGTPRAFDVLHDHAAFSALAAAPMLPLPVVHTIHGAFDEKMRRFYTAVAQDATFVAISDAQRAGMPELPVAAVVPNAVDVSGYTPRHEKGDFIACVGRICRDKGQEVAVQVAKRAGVPLVLAGKIDPGTDQEYFEKEILPYVDGETVRFEGEVSDHRKRELVAQSRAMLFPIRWDEPFGLVMVEALAGGTPVIAMRAGAVPEVVRDGTTGFIVDDEDAMVAAVARIGEIDPAACRRDAEERFSPSIMAERYEAVYRQAIASWPR